MYERCHLGGQVYEVLRPSLNWPAGESGERGRKSYAGVEKVEVRGWAGREVCMRGVIQVARCMRF